MYDCCGASSRLFSSGTRACGTLSPMPYATMSATSSRRCSTAKLTKVAATSLLSRTLYGQPALATAAALARWPQGQALAACGAPSRYRQLAACSTRVSFCNFLIRQLTADCFGARWLIGHGAVDMMAQPAPSPATTCRTRGDPPPHGAQPRACTQTTHHLSI